MDIAEARAESPCFIPPVTDAPQLVVVGGGETSEFLRQSDDYVAQYKTPERPMERYDVPNDDHFDELDRLAEDDSVLFEKTMQMVTS
jgi:arylformamidase